MRITEWEAKVKELNKEEGVTLDPMIMLATLTEICTAEIRDMIYQQGDGLFKDKHPTAMKRAFADIREKIISWTANKIASSAANLNVGNFQVEYPYEEMYIWENADQCQGCENEWTGEPMDINMMGKCYSCGEVGHPQRLCPKGAKGKGKSGFVGKGVNFGGGGQKGFKGKGAKGFYGKGGRVSAGGWLLLRFGCEVGGNGD